MKSFGKWSDLPFFIQEWLQEGEKRRFRVRMSRRLFAAKHFLVFAISTKSMFSLFPHCPVSPDPDYCPWVSKDEKCLLAIRLTSPACHKGLSTYFFNKILLNVMLQHLWKFVIKALFFFFQYNFIEHAHVQLTFTKDNLQQNENYNLKLKKKKPNTIKTLVVTKWERNQLSKQNFIPYLKETKKQTILFWNLFRDQSYKKYIFLD